MTCKKYSSVALRVIFRFYMFGILSKTLPSIFHQGWEAVCLNLRYLESRHYCRRRYSCIRYCHRSCCCHRHSPLSILSHCRSSLSMVSHRHLPPQPLSHEITLMQMGVLNLYHVSNLKFRSLKSNYALS